MSETEISVSDAALHLNDVVERAHSQQQTFVLTKDGVPVAQLGPVTRRTGLGRDIAAALADVELTPEEFQAWRRDIQEGFEILLPPVDKWE